MFSSVTIFPLILAIILLLESGISTAQNQNSLKTQSGASRVRRMVQADGNDNVGALSEGGSIPGEGLYNQYGYIDIVSPGPNDKPGTPLASLSLSTPPSSPADLLNPPPITFDICSPASNASSTPAAARFKLLPISNMESFGIRTAGGIGVKEGTMLATGGMPEAEGSNQVLVKLLYSSPDEGPLGDLPGQEITGKCLAFDPSSEGGIPITLEACDDLLDLDEEVAGGLGAAESGKSLKVFWYDVVKGIIRPHIPVAQETAVKVQEATPARTTLAAVTSAASVSPPTRSVVTTAVTEEFTILYPSPTLTPTGHLAHTIHVEPTAPSNALEADEAMVFSVLGSDNASTDVGRAITTSRSIPLPTSPFPTVIAASVTSPPVWHRTTTVFHIVETTMTPRLAATSLAGPAYPQYPGSTNHTSDAMGGDEDTAPAEMNNYPGYDIPAAGEMNTATAQSEQAETTEELGLPPLPDGAVKSEVQRRTSTSTGTQAVTYVKPSLIARYPKFFSDNQIHCDLTSLSAASSSAPKLPNGSVVDPAVLNQCLSSLKIAEAATTTSDWNEAEALAYILICMQMSKLTTMLAQSDELVKCTHDGGIPGMQMAWANPENATTSTEDDGEAWEWVEEYMSAPNSPSMPMLEMLEAGPPVEEPVTMQTETEVYDTSNPGDIWPAPYYLRFRKEST